MSEAQFDDNDALFGGSWDYPADDPAPAPAPEPSTNSWDSSPEPAPAAARPASAPKPAKAAKPAPPPKAPKAPKVKAEKAPKAAPVTADDGTLNIFGSIGAGFGIGGYSVGAMQEYLGAVGNSTVTSNKYHDINFGEGINIEIGAGYMVVPNVEMRFSVGGNYGLLAPTTGRKGSTGNAPGTEDVKNSYYSWGIKTMVAPKFEILELLEVYVGAGLSLNLAGSSYDSTYIRDNGAIAKVNYERQFSPAVGFCGAGGIFFPLSDEMSFYGEVQFDAVNFTLNRLKPVKEENITSNPDDINYRDSNRPAPPMYPGSNWSLRAGIKLWVM
jgi:opacity protein-like surface antigen